LRIKDKAREFNEKIKFSTNECEGGTVQLLWLNCKTSLKEISEEVLGFSERQIRSEWYDGECAEATKLKKKKKMLTINKCLKNIEQDIS
jgi:hypothetical protein